MGYGMIVDCVAFYCVLCYAMACMVGKVIAYGGYIAGKEKPAQGGHNWLTTDFLPNSSKIGLN